MPGAHGVAAPLPTLQNVPLGHVTHSLRLDMKSRDASACVPPGHGCGAEEPSTHSEPLGHTRQAVFRSVDVYLPPGHNAHVALLAFAPNVPGKHSAGAADPAGQLVPDGQVMHSPRLDMNASDALACVPCGHSCGPLEPSTHSPPTGQSVHAVLPELSVNLPPGHKSHVDELSAALNEPGRHCECAVEPVEHAEPAGHRMHELAL